MENMGQITWSQNNLRLFLALWKQNETKPLGTGLSATKYVNFGTVNVKWVEQINASFQLLAINIEKAWKGNYIYFKWWVT